MAISSSVGSGAPHARCATAWEAARAARKTDLKNILSLFKLKMMVRKVELSLTSGCYTGDGGDGDATIIVTADGQSLSTLILEDNSRWPPRVMSIQLCNVCTAARPICKTPVNLVYSITHLSRLRGKSPDLPFSYWAEYHHDHDWVVDCTWRRAQRGPPIA